MRRRIYWLWSGQWRKGGVSATYLDNIPEGWERLALKSIFCIFIFLLCIMKMKQSAFLLVQSPFHVHPLSAEKCVFKHVTSRGLPTVSSGMSSAGGAVDVCLFWWYHWSLAADHVPAAVVMAPAWGGVGPWGTQSLSVCPGAERLAVRSGHLWWF